MIKKVVIFTMLTPVLSQSLRVLKDPTAKTDPLVDHAKDVIG